MSHKKEIWKPITINGKKTKIAYMISNHGHFGVMNNGKIEVRTFKPIAGVYRYNMRLNGTTKAIFLTKETANAFIKKPSSKHRLVIHKDHNYLNNHADNLVWVTPQAHRLHIAKSPKSVLARQKNAITKSVHAHVLNEKTVLALKKMIWDPKRKLSFKKLAEKFGVSEMQVYRIKSGEFWYHVKVDNEPVRAKYKQNLSNVLYHEKIAAKISSAKNKAVAKRKPVVKAKRKK